MRMRIVPTWFLFDLGMVEGDCAGNDFVFDWSVGSYGIMMKWKWKWNGIEENVCF